MNDLEKNDKWMVLEHFAPELQQLVQKEGLDGDKLCLAVSTDENQKPRILNRHEVFVSDGQKAFVWNVPSLRALFRGNKVSPRLENYPPQYTPHFVIVESHALVMCENLGDRTDGEFEEIYSNMRRRPDGRSLGAGHDYIWQAAALLLGTREVSQSEFEALFGRLAQAARTFRMGLVSRNYVHYTRKMLNGELE